IEPGLRQIEAAAHAVEIADAALRFGIPWGELEVTFQRLDGLPRVLQRVGNARQLPIGGGKRGLQPDGGSEVRLAFPVASRRSLAVVPAHLKARTGLRAFARLFGFKATAPAQGE